MSEESAWLKFDGLCDRMEALAAELAALGHRFHELNRNKSDYLYGRALSYELAASRIRMELDK